MSGEHEVCDVTVYESMLLRLSTRRREKQRFQKYPLWKAFSSVCVLGNNLKRRLRVDARSKRIRMYAFTDVNVCVWTGPKTLSFFQDLVVSMCGQLEMAECLMTTAMQTDM